ncbi:MAG: TRAP transporter permease [Beijerinckiaceae bacterium]
MTAIQSMRSGLITVLCVAFACFHVYTGMFGVYPVAVQTGVHLSFILALILLVRPTEPPISGAGGRAIALAYDLFVSACAAAAMGYRLINLDYLESGRFEFVTPLTTLETWLGVALCFAVLDLCRRETGWALVAIIIVVLLYPAIPNLPGILAHRGYDLGTQMDAQYMTLAGIFSVPLSASAEFIALFIIFGAFLERSGLGKVIMDLTLGLVGRTRGGPAKVAVIGSAMHGTISGSAPANVLTVGVLTIPLMKRMGYPAHMAGAIEAAASTGGVIMPPIMGSVAFIMAQFMGVPYGMIALYALIPAILYFFGIFLTVHWSALRHNVGAIPESELPDWRASLLSHGHLLLPIVVLVYMLAHNYSAQYSATVATLSVIAVSWLRPHTRMGWREILGSLEAGAKGALLVGIATAAAGMIVGVFELTGVALKMVQVSSAVVQSLLLGLVVTMFITIALGMGVPPSVSYIVQVAVTIPMLQGFLKAGGVPADTALVATHFFVMYYAALAVLTPPDALASVAAAGIARSPFLKTAVHATRVAFVAFIIPFMFVYRPALLTLGTWDEIASALVFAALGIVALSVALEGHAFRPLRFAERALAFVTGCLLVVPNWMADTAGLGLFLALAVLQWPAMRASFKAGPSAKANATG